MKITVTADDVRLARRCSPDSCPLRLAFERAMPGSEPSVAHEWLCHGSWTARRLVRLPHWVTERIRAYDKTGVMEPFEVELEV